MAQWVKNSPANAEDTEDVGSIAGSGRSPGGGKWQPTPAFLLEKFHEKRSWWATVQTVTKSQI